MGQSCSCQPDRSAPSSVPHDQEFSFAQGPGQVTVPAAAITAAAPTSDGPGKERTTGEDDDCTHPQRLRPAHKTVSIAPVAAFLDPHGAEGEQSVKSAAGGSVPATPADWLLKAHPLDSPASPSPEETIVSPPCPAPLEPAGGDAHGLHETHPAEALAPILEADSSADQPPDEVSGGPQLSPSASPQAGGVAAAGRRGRTTESANRAHDHGDAESVAASRAAPTIGHSARSQLSSASERSYLTGVPDACNSEVSATAMERLPSAAASSTGGGRKCSGHKSDGHKSGSHKSGSHKSGSHKSGSHKSGSSHHSSSSSDSEDGDDELHLDEASKASLHIMGTAIPAAVVDGGEGLGGAAGMEGSTGVREEEGDEEEVLAEDGAVVVDACADGHDVGQLRRAIPPHCFERSVLRSSAYLILDLVAAAVLYYASTFIDLAPTWLAWGLLWPAYWFWQGAVCTGLWVVAHECGHQAFSKWQAVNDGVGLIVHSALLVPYYSWKHSHRRHHSNTGSITRDEVFVPATDESQVPFNASAVYRAGLLVVQQLLGWPGYLAFNAAGREYSRFACHFDPWSPIFTKRERIEVAVSDAALAVVIYGLYNLGLAFGWPWLVKTYVMPYLVVNFWLVCITFLQHTHPGLPHYDDQDWDWLRGALATVDRSYGILDHFFHHIADTHVAHHLFSTMPHYHAEEATKALRPILGAYYCRDTRPIMRALWEESATCHYVAPDAPGSGTLWFRSMCRPEGAKEE